MKIYKVGGYVRDKLMGLEPKDCDYVVVGSSESEMLNLGYTLVGKDFPVFHHPETGDEYALARTERKTGLGYGGFEVDTKGVTLEEDLFRRDLTINAMALDDNENLIDPYHGKEDLKNHTLRHVSEHFKEDPVRILRIARFSARYNFSIAEETLKMMREMVDNGEFDHLTEERVWKEFEKTLSEQYIENFFINLEKIGALEKLPGFDTIIEKEFFNFIRVNSEMRFDLNLVHIFSQISNKDLKTWKIPSNLIQKINIFSEWKEIGKYYSTMNNVEKLKFIQQNKGLHSQENIEHNLYLINFYLNWKTKNNISFENEVELLRKDILTLKSVNYEDIVKEALANKQKPKEEVKNIQLSLLDRSKPKFKF